MADGHAAGDQMTLDAHLESVRFWAGVEVGRWHILHYAFTELVVRVTGSAVDASWQSTMDFQLICDGFPAKPVFAQRWDTVARTRPPPPDQGPPGVIDALKTWNCDSDSSLYGGIYRPWQRHAAAHNNWTTLRPHLAWRRDRHLTFVMEQLYELASEQAAWEAARAAA